MKAPIHILGSWLEDKSINVDERMDAAIKVVLGYENMPTHSIGKAYCFTVYRFLDNYTLRIVSLKEIIAKLKPILKKVEDDPNKHDAARWGGSMRIATEYLRGKIDTTMSTEELLTPMADLWRIQANHTGAVNACRACAILAAGSAEPNVMAAHIKSCFTVFQEAVKIWQLEGCSYASGVELTEASRAVSFCMALCPFAKIAFAGGVMNVADMVNLVSSNEIFHKTIKRKMGV